MCLTGGMKTNYVGHDKAYRSRKNEGMPGWDSASQIKKNIATLEYLFQNENVPKKGKLLELGCGAGNTSLWLAESGYDVSGTDISPFAIEWAKENAEKCGTNADFQLGNVLNLKQYPDSSFDIILDGHCFHCIIGDDRKLFLSSAGRVLKEGGILLVATMCGEVKNEEAQPFYDLRSRFIIHEVTAVRYIGLADDILGEIKGAGFRILHREVKPCKDEKDQGELLVIATK